MRDPWTPAVSYKVGDQVEMTIHFPRKWWERLLRRPSSKTVEMQVKSVISSDEKE